MSAPTPEERAEAVHDWAIQHEYREWSDLEAEIARQIRAAEAEALREAKRIVEAPENTREDAARILGEEADRRERE